QLKIPDIFSGRANRAFSPLSCSASSKCRLKGMILIRPDSNSVKSVIFGRWFVLMNTLKFGRNSKLFSCRYLAVMVSFPVSLLVSAASSVIFFSGSEIFTKREPASRAISSDGPPLDCTPNFVDRRLGSAFFPYSPRMRSTDSIVVPFPFLDVAPYKMNMHSILVSPDKEYPSAFWSYRLLEVSPCMTSSINESHLGQTASGSYTTGETFVRNSTGRCSRNSIVRRSSVPFWQLKR